MPLSETLWFLLRILARAVLNVTDEIKAWPPFQLARNEPMLQHFLFCEAIEDQALCKLLGEEYIFQRNYYCVPIPDAKKLLRKLPKQTASVLQQMIKAARNNGHDNLLLMDMDTIAQP